MGRSAALGAVYGESDDAIPSIRVAMIRREVACRNSSQHRYREPSRGVGRKSFSRPTLTTPSVATTLRQLGKARRAGNPLRFCLSAADPARGCALRATLFQTAKERFVMTRRTPNGYDCRVVRYFVATFALCAGCSGPILRPQSPEARIDLPPMPDVKYVSEYTHPFGMNYVKIEAVSLVTGLPGTGSDPPPTPQRAALLDEMRRRDIANPNEILASGNTSL